MSATCAQCGAALTEAAALIKEAVEALTPFAHETEDWSDKMDCEDIPADATDIKISDLRRAYAIYTKLTGEKQ